MSREQRSDLNRKWEKRRPTNHLIAGARRVPKIVSSVNRWRWTRKQFRARNSRNATLICAFTLRALSCSNVNIALCVNCAILPAYTVSNIHCVCIYETLMKFILLLYATAICTYKRTRARARARTNIAICTPDHLRKRDER